MVALIGAAGSVNELEWAQLHSIGDNVEVVGARTDLAPSVPTAGRVITHATGWVRAAGCLGKFIVATSKTLATNNGTVARQDYAVAEFQWGTAASALGTPAKSVEIQIVQGPTSGAVPTLTKNPGVLWQVPLTLYSVAPGGVVTYDDVRPDIAGRTGEIVALASVLIPTTALICDGTTVSVSAYRSLWKALNKPGGAAATTFQLPDGRGRMLVGAGTFAAVGDSDTLAEVDRTPRHSHPAGTATAAAAGAHNHGAGTLATSNAPDHTHGAGGLATSVVTMDSLANTTTGGSAGRLTAAAGNVDHGHGVNGSTAASGGHGHGVNGLTGDAATHTHAITGSTAGTSTRNATPFLGVNWIIYT